MILANEGRSLRLRQTIPDDAPTLLRAYEDESFITLYRSNNARQTEEQLRKVLEKRQQYLPTQFGYLEFMLEHKQYGAIGVAALGDYSPLHQRAEYLVGLFEEQRRYVGHGVEATLLILDLAFNTYRLNKVYSYVYGYNEFSQKNMLNFGFKHEGTLEEHHFSIKKDKFIDLNVNGMTLRQFRANEKLKKLSLRLVGRDITQPIQVIKIPVDNKLSSDDGKKFLEGLRAMADYES